MGIVKAKQVTLKCPACGRSFKRQRYNHKYCSGKCKNRTASTRWREKAQAAVEAMVERAAESGL